MKDFIKELCPEIADWQAELIAEHCQPKREWVFLSNEEIDDFWKTEYFNIHYELPRAIEAKLKERNS